MIAPVARVIADQVDTKVNSVLIAIPAHRWHTAGGDSWAGMASLWVSVACLIIAIAGPSIQWWWTRRTRRAAKRAKLEERFHLGQLVAIVDDLDAAIMAGDPQQIHCQLENWRRQAAYVSGLLTGAKSDAAFRCMSKSMSLAREASTALLRGESAVSAYMDARDAITAARDTLITWVSRQSRHAGSR
jgi:hypothetical protein